MDFKILYSSVFVIVIVVAADLQTAILDCEPKDCWGELLYGRIMDI